MGTKSMEAAHGREECELREGELLRLAGAAGRHVRCMAGIVWITVANHPADIFLKPGECFVIPNHGLVLAEAIGGGRMQVDARHALPSSPARMRERARGGLRKMQMALACLASHALRMRRQRS